MLVWVLQRVLCGCNPQCVNVAWGTKGCSQVPFGSCVLLLLLRDAPGGKVMVLVCCVAWPPCQLGLCCVPVQRVDQSTNRDGPCNRSSVQNRASLGSGARATHGMSTPQAQHACCLRL